MISLIILTLLAGFMLIGAFVARRRRRTLRDGDSLPLFVVPATSPSRVARPSTGRITPARVPSHGAMRQPHDDGAERDGRFAPSAPTIRTRDGAVSTLSLPSRNDHAVSQPDEATGHAIDGASVRYWRVADGTLQFLPGRLEIAAGHDAGHEIRFVRTAGPDGTTITFGRADGPPYRHVQLREPTVSRTHARMVLASSAGSNGLSSGGTTDAGPAHWRLENLSSTNPVTVNGRPMDANGGTMASVMLSDGDRIEMGEVAFVFHSR
jgi:hypothetical protein